MSEAALLTSVCVCVFGGVEGPLNQTEENMAVGMGRLAGRLGGREKQKMIVTGGQYVSNG